MKILISSVFILLLPFFISAQEVVMEEYPEEAYNDNGPDSKLYNHAYFGIGLISNHDQNEGSEIRMPNSFEFMFGLRHKLQLLSFYAVGSDISYRYQRYCIDQDALSENELNPLAANLDAKRQAIGINSFGLEIYNRFKAGRGNNLGYYIDAGIKGEWNFALRRKVFFDYDSDQYPAGKVKYTERNLDYINRTSLIATGRIGFKKTVVYGNYRISDLLKTNNNIADLPRLSIGLQRAL
jgi:hypothetical protein